MTLIKKNSKIHGLGLFTTKFIPKGSIIGEFTVLPAIYNTKFTIWVDDEPYRAQGILKYSNHSSTPNAEVVFPEMVAIQDIKAGDEIYWNYGEDFEEK